MAFGGLLYGRVLVVRLSALYALTLLFPVIPWLGPRKKKQCHFTIWRLEGCWACCCCLPVTVAFWLVREHHHHPNHPNCEISFYFVAVTPPWNHGGVIFSLQFICVCVYLCVCVCVCFRLCLWTKFQPNGWTDLDAVFAKWLLIALAQTSQRVKGQGHSDVMPIFSSKFSVNFPTLYFSSLMYNQNEIQYVA